MVPSSPPTVNPQVCPVCGNANQCALVLERRTGEPQGPCWCMAMSFQAEVLERVPPQAVGVACLCAACAAHSSGTMAA
ncbi:MAG: cysteine-rich CWC family protein [Rhodoferax sp.]|nr:cysteine-rich CWC family protein [Rhodoferax sp.]